MPGSQSLIGGGSVPGLTLRAWALYDGVNFILRSSFGVSSFVRAAAGTYNMTLSAALPHQTAVVIVRTERDNSSGKIKDASIGYMNSTTTAQILARGLSATSSGNEAVINFDGGSVWVEIYQ